MACEESDKVDNKPKMSSLKLQEAQVWISASRECLAVARWYELRYVWLLARSGEWLIVNCKELRHDCMVTSYNGWIGIVKRSATAGFELSSVADPDVLGLLDTDPLVRGTDPDPAKIPDPPDKNKKKNLYSYSFATSFFEKLCKCTFKK